MDDWRTVKALKQALGAHLPWHGARLTFVARFILALLQVRTVNLSRLAVVFSPRAKPSSNYIRLQRFLRGFKIDQALIARAVTGMLPLGEHWVLSLDRSNWKLGKAELNMLVLGVVYQGIAIPLFWTALGKAGNSNTAERIALMERFCTTFGSVRIQYLLADREFVGSRWWGYLKHSGIAFRIRIKKNLSVSTARGEMPVVRLFADLAQGQRRVLRAPRAVAGVRLYLAAQRLSADEWLIVVSSDTPHRSLSQYAERWSIETLFAALKSHGFHWEETHLLKPERLERLLALLTLATAWAVLAGHWANQHQPIRQKKRYSGPSTASSDTDSICCSASSLIAVSLHRYCFN